MSKYLFIFALVSLFAVSTTSYTGAWNSHLRLLVHDTEPLNGGVAIAGWVIAPNISSSPSKWLVIAGPRFAGEIWWVELMGGVVLNEGAAIPLLDVRGNLSLRPINVWTNLQWINPSRNLREESALYWYFEGNYPILNKFSLGLETENMIQKNANDFSFGPHVTLGLGTTTLITAYQFHFNGDQALWLRVVFNF